MDKAILVIDMPENCWSCSLIVEKENGCKVCPVTNCTLISRDGKFPWCPLKPMPRMRFTYIGHDSESIADYNDGWNNCIRKIMGE